MDRRDRLRFERERRKGIGKLGDGDRGERDYCIDSVESRALSGHTTVREGNDQETSDAKLAKLVDKLVAVFFLFFFSCQFSFWLHLLLL